jgi:oligosaccharyltransferase complex subunit alpha (ribophorin I)
VLSEITLRLPPSAHSVYYYDVIGNVSTSHFRSGQPAIGKKRVVDSTLEIRPRYPVLGGWNYSFTVGWDMPLAENLRTDGDREVLEVPFLTPLKGVVVDEEELTIILPEGATDVEVFAPFAVDTIEHATHRTYLDTIGRPKVTITKRSVTENHAQPVYVTYRYPLSARFAKPIAVGAFAGSALALFMLLRRVNYNIDKK